MSVVRSKAQKCIGYFTALNYLNRSRRFERGPFVGKSVLNVSDLLLYFLYVLLCHACNHITKFKKGPGGYLIRVDLIRFPGSIPGATQMCTYTNYAKQRSKVSILNIRQVVGLGIEVRVSILNIDKYWVLTTITNPTKNFVAL